MNDGNHTGNAQKLPLAERARQGLLAGEPELSLQEILALEHPADPQARRALGAAIRVEFKYGDLPAREQRWRREVRRKVSTWLHPIGAWAIGDGDPPSKVVTDVSVVVSWWIGKESYRAWRAQCPKHLLSEPPLSKINKWLGEPAVETSLPEPPAIVATALTESQQDKRDCQEIARALWAEQPAATQSDLLKHPRIKPYLNQWRGKNTVPGWLSEVDPRPKEQRRGRPRKTPV